MLDLELQHVAGEIDSDAYPEWARRYEIHGTTVIEYGLAADGAVVRQRVILSSPASVFDEAVIAAFAQYRYGVAGAPRLPRACGGNIRSITWRMQDHQRPRLPNFDPLGDPVS